MFNKSIKKYFLSSFFVFSLVGAGILLCVFLAGSKSALAEAFDPATKTGDNVSGFAWSENFGWVSFNSIDFTGVQKDIHGDVVVPTYGVNVRYRDGRVSGYAWGENIGWISFESNHLSPGDTAVYFDKVNNRFSGTAKIYALDSSGRLRFRNGGANPFGVSTYAQTNPKYGELRGWAWNGNGTSDPAMVGVGLGWLNFNSTDTSAGGGPYMVKADLNYTPKVDSDAMWRIEPTNSSGAEEKVMPSGLGVISVGDKAEFRVDWSDNDTGDRVRFFVCKNSTPINPTLSSPPTIPNNTASLATKNINNWDCDGGATERWCNGTVTNDQVANMTCERTILLSDTPSPTPKNYYISICDEFGYCTKPATSSPFIVNDQPVVSGQDADAASGLTGPGGLAVVTAPPLVGAPIDPQPDHRIIFKANWSDNQTNNHITMHVCKTDSFIYQHGVNQGCMTGEEWCSDDVTPGAAHSGTISCTRDMVDSDKNSAGPNDYYIRMCDGYGACSASSVNGDFIINRRPIVGAGMSAPNWQPSQATANPYTESDLRADLIWSIDDTADPTATNMTDALLNIQGGGANLSGRSTTATLGTGACNTTQCTVKLRDTGAGILGMIKWNTPYRWTARVKDAYAWSEVKVYNHGGGQDGVLTDDTTGLGAGMNALVNASSPSPNLTFTTYKHNFPMVLHDPVTYFPGKPSANEEVRATPHSFRYDDDKPAKGSSDVLGEARECVMETPTDCQFMWNIDVANGAFKQADNSWAQTLTWNSSPAVVRFTTEGSNQTYGLTVKDGDDYFEASSQAAINYVNEKLPSWQEVK